MKARGTGHFLIGKSLTAASQFWQIRKAVCCNMRSGNLPFQAADYFKVAQEITMTLNEAMAAYGPEWLNIWLPVLFGGAFILPAALLIWKSTRITAVICLVASFVGGFATSLLYTKMGYVKLLGLPHIVVWTPLLIFLVYKIRSPEVPRLAKLVMCIISAVIVVSLMFDYLDVIKYIMGDRAAAGAA